MALRFSKDPKASLNTLAALAPTSVRSNILRPRIDMTAFALVILEIRRVSVPIVLSPSTLKSVKVGIMAAKASCVNCNSAAKAACASWSVRPLRFRVKDRENPSNTSAPTPRLAAALATPC